MDRRCIFGALAIPLTLLAGGAQAADLPTKKSAPAPIMAPAPYSWTGAYVGLQGGYGWGSQEVYLPSVWWRYWGDERHGGFGGALAGYDYQMGNVVVGLQADYNVANITGGASPFGGKYNTSSTVNSFGAVDLKLGYAADRVLVYALGGLGLMNVSYTLNQPLYPYAYGKYNDFRAMPNVGVGVEYAVNTNWTAFADVRYFRSASQSYSAMPVLGPRSITEVNTIYRLGVTYKFGG
ncbi:outer membrane immunogenic protein [Roseiarcus fermentans]|uniref:Outer membrane immunogenic protein n=1 Tax=Roseiarcus fermentans TaxID=1473586 RepID=A0A366F1T2_9HYPH|nr:outer membrane beta-barrel protein [Roseiarcus fermentans]RBP08557.1 outer membrane immunogenic protein [Roseiarcus fermentans]